MHELAVSSPQSRSRQRGSRLRQVSVALLSAVAIAVPLAVVSTPPPAVAVTDEDPSFVLNQNDLEFILRQIQISEAHAADELDPSNYTLLCASPQDASGSCVPDIARPAGVRTVDGSYNNLRVAQSEYGASDLAFPRLLDPVWLEGETVPQGAPPNTAGQNAVCGSTGPMGQTCYAQTEGFV